MFSSNLIGFVLAIVSSAFIGSSFIIKKKGLQRATLNGSRASCLSLSLSLSLTCSLRFQCHFALPNSYFQVVEATVTCYNLFGGSEWLPVST